MSQVRTESITVQAGFGGKCQHVAQSLVFAMSGQMWRFVQIQKHARWFTAGVAGSRAHKGDLHAVKVLDEIRGQSFVPEETGPDADADIAAVADTEDPMDALDDVAAVDKKPTRNSSKTKFISRP